MKQGFSLVELSIVLVVLGLLTGGILTGQNLIRAAEIRSITSQRSSFQTAMNSFRDKYMALPGDLSNASEFWAAAVSGNGNSQIEPATADGGDGEIFGFWEQLALGGFIEGSYTGTSGDGGPGLQDAIIGTNVPEANIGNAGWSVYYLGSVDAADSDFFPGSYDHVFLVGNKTVNDLTTSAIITPDEAWNIDKKLDDANPQTGKVRALENLSAADNSACSNTTTERYSLDNTDQACTLVFSAN